MAKRAIPMMTQFAWACEVSQDAREVLVVHSPLVPDKAFIPMPDGEPAEVVNRIENYPALLEAAKQACTIAHPMYKGTETTMEALVALGTEVSKADRNDS